MTSHINPVDEQATEATSKLTLGVIGLGAMGSKLLEATIGHADFDVAVAADSNAASRASASTLISGLRTVASADEVLTDPSIDAVYIATPPESHATLTLAALAQGKHVFCEKPLTIQLDQGQAMVEAAKESGKICAVNFALSDRNSIIHLEQSIRAGELGELRGAEIRLQFPQWPREFQSHAGWLAEREQGGFIREVLSHFIYLTQRMLGTLDVKAHDVRFPDDGGSEIWLSALLTADDVPVQIHASAGAASHENYEWYLWGTERSYLLKDCGKLSQHQGNGWQPVELPANRGGEDTRLSLFAAAIRGAERPNLASFEEAFGVQKVVEALLS
ncbi:NAD-dependant oxidoreductase [Renibacterium salmoninarum ATCC 33209]|uniref:NAD-dependant oxidoreductase n=1 Tax=Renibacterium salmoninarum (strain ATCC 33209 / DSM 20767 / JCM 11484 / NBRC 15589 / NCIMB 2235) TaxID=288705 RepID=A9WNY0_RENSM|nr:Gfo/Idh/MocA family oxidoreductase [Renibacterium salmoninarum]ABY22775.1 NAD-dependant oxidoreductase [Renibacterium salmoninarum ATCC 33209]